MQLGVQHTDDDVLRKINRGALTKDTVSALRLLKDTCYKVSRTILSPRAVLTTFIFFHMRRRMFEIMIVFDGYPCVSAHRWIST